MASHTKSAGTTHSRKIPDSRKAKTDRKAEGPKKMAAHTSPTTQAQIQQAG
jgi:hypothetical protein